MGRSTDIRGRFNYLTKVASQITSPLNQHSHPSCKVFAFSIDVPWHFVQFFSNLCKMTPHWPTLSENASPQVKWTIVRHSAFVADSAAPDDRVIPNNKMAAASTVTPNGGE
jgi:hypothetical protein